MCHQTSHYSLCFISFIVSFSLFTSQLSSLPIRKTVKNALSDLSLKKAIGLEMTAIYQNWTSNLVPWHLGKQTIGYKWVYMIKFNLNGSVDRLKARLVAKTYTHTYGINYEETFSLAAKISYVWCLFLLLQILTGLCFNSMLKMPSSWRLGYASLHGPPIWVCCLWGGSRKCMQVKNSIAWSKTITKSEVWIVHWSYVGIWPS